MLWWCSMVCIVKIFDHEVPLSILTWFWNSLKSSIYINFGAHCLNSSRFLAGFLQRLSANGLGLNVVIIWYIVTSGLRFQILSATFPKRSIITLNDSPFSYFIFIKAIDVRWCDRLVANWVPNFSTKVSKQSIHNDDNRANQLKVAPFKFFGNTQHRMTSFHVYKLTYIV